MIPPTHPAAGAQPDFARIREEDRRNWFHPWEYMPAAGAADRTIVDRGEGIYVYDENGQRLIDGPGGMWCVQIGYNRREMAEAIAEQALRMPYMNPFSLTSAPPARLAARLAALAPGDLTHVFFTTGGSTAVDTALRFVHFYNNVRGRPRKKHIISRALAYHGSTYLCALVTGKDRDKNWFDVASPFAHLLPHVNPSRRPQGMSVAAFCDQKVRELEDKILELGAENVGAFIAEPIQASGGVVVPPGALRWSPGGEGGSTVAGLRATPAGWVAALRDGPLIFRVRLEGSVPEVRVGDPVALELDDATLRPLEAPAGAP